MRSLLSFPLLVAAAAETYDAQVGNTCTDWKLVSSHTGGGTVTLDQNLEKSPVGIYRITNGATIATSTQNLYIADQLGYATENCPYCWTTKATTESDYPKCSTDGANWKPTWDISGRKNMDSQENFLVGKHRSDSGACCGWILLHNGATYPGGLYSSSPDAHPCAVAGSHTTGQGSLKYTYACQSTGTATHILTGPASTKYTWSQARAASQEGGSGWDLAKKQDICGTDLSSKVTTTATSGGWLPVLDDGGNSLTGEYMYASQDMPNVSGDGNTLRSCELHHEWPGHSNTKPAWSEDHSRDDLIADVVYCAGGSSAFTTTLSPTKAPTKAPTPLSEHATISAIAAAITALEAKVATLETTVAAEKGKVADLTTLLNSCGACTHLNVANDGTSIVAVKANYGSTATAGILKLNY